MKKITSYLLVVILISSIIQVTPVNAATEEEIQSSIQHGIDWLANAQYTWEEDPMYLPDGGWGHPEEWERTAMTGFALTKLQDRAYELGYESPFDPEYEYSEQVIAGWEYIFSSDESDPLYAKVVELSLQDHTSAASGSVDDPDANGNGIGIKFISENPGEQHATYTTGVVLMALEATGTPDRENEVGYDFDDDGNPDTYQEIAQDAVDWLAFAQGDSGDEQGAWGYTSIDNDFKEEGWWIPDNSNSGYATLGLYAGEAFGCTVPQWVKTML
ncbi:hypothetical protein KAT55_07170, partial [Candidatus Bathyarchaeota archaeon]|nr:hypothetical protein [Candidatus Bathyarchaeota archaeon]